MRTPMAIIASYGLDDAVEVDDPVLLRSVVEEESRSVALMPSPDDPALAACICEAE
jgi:hypothetical protein